MARVSTQHRRVASTAAVAAACLLLCATASEGALRGGAPAAAGSRRLDTGVPCSSTLPDLPYLPGTASLGYGFNIVSGESGKAPLFGTSPDGDAWTHQGVQVIDGVCYKVPDVLINPKTGFRGVIPDHEDDLTFYAASGVNSVAFQHDWSKQQSNSFSLSGSYGEISGHAAYTHSKDMKMVISKEATGKTATTRLHNNVHSFRALPQQFRILPEGLNTLIGLVAEDAPFRDPTDTYDMTWETYFKNYGTHVLTEAAMGGRVIIQYFFEDSSTKDGSSTLKKQSDCLSAGISAGLGKKGSLSADTSNCWNNTDGTTSSASTALSKHKGYITCVGGGAGGCPQLSTDGHLDLDQLNAWKKGLAGDNLNPNVVSAEWVDIQLGVIATEHGTEGWQVMGFESHAQFETVKATLHEMLMRYLMENGMCATYPGSCGAEQNAVNALHALVAKAGVLDIDRATSPITALLTGLNNGLDQIHAAFTMVEGSGGWTGPTMEASDAFKSYDLAQSWLANAWTGVTTQSTKLHASVGLLATKVAQALQPPTDLPKIVPGLAPECTTTGGNVPEGSQCVFPFTYKGTTYDSCTKDGHHTRWCSTDADYSGSWGHCGTCKDPNAAARAAHDAAAKAMADGISAAQSELADILRASAEAIAAEEKALTAVVHALESSATGFGHYATATVPWSSKWVKAMNAANTAKENANCQKCWAGGPLFAAVCLPVCLGNVPGVVANELAAAKVIATSLIHLQFTTLQTELKAPIAANQKVVASFGTVQAGLRSLADDVAANAAVEKTQAVLDWWRKPLLPELLELAQAQPAVFTDVKSLIF